MAIVKAIVKNVEKTEYMLCTFVSPTTESFLILELIGW